MPTKIKEVEKKKDKKEKSKPKDEERPSKSKKDRKSSKKEEKENDQARKSKRGREKEKSAKTGKTNEKSQNRDLTPEISVMQQIKSQNAIIVNKKKIAPMSKTPMGLQSSIGGSFRTNNMSMMNDSKIYQEDYASIIHEDYNPEDDDSQDEQREGSDS